MTKAEKFIQDYTNHCSNELEGGGYHEWLTPEQARAAVEIARDEMLKKEPKFKIGDVIRFKGNETLEGEEETHKIVGYDNELYIFEDGTTDLFSEQDLYELVKEPVSEELEEAAYQYANCFKHQFGMASMAFIKGAKWQKEQFEKNRLKHCNSITNEQAELEQGFIDQHIDKYQRMPTFLDAIEYGMRLQKYQMMAKSIDGVIAFDYYGNNNKTYGCIAHDSFCLEDFGLKDNDNVKMIIFE